MYVTTQQFNGLLMAAMRFHGWGDPLHLAAHPHCTMCAAIRTAVGERTHEREQAILRAQIAPLAEGQAAAREEARRANEEAYQWRLKARGRGGRGFVVGVGVGALAAIGATGLIR